MNCTSDDSAALYPVYPSETADIIYHHTRDNNSVHPLKTEIHPTHTPVANPSFSNHIPASFPLHHPTTT